MKSVLTIFLLLNYITSFTQTSEKTVAEYDAIRVGDKMPTDFKMKTFNYQTGLTSTAKLSDYKGKLLILDMWATSCVACIKSFSHLEELQKKYPGKIQILLINSSDSLSWIQKSLKKREKATKESLSLPIIFSDSIIGWKLFKHASVPHVAWISGQSKVLSVTEGEEVNEKNINALLNGDKTSIPQKDDYLVDQLNYNRYKPYFVQGNTGNGETILWYSVLSGRIEGLPGTGGINSVPKFKASTISANNWSIKELYRLAFTDVPYYHPNLPPAIELPLSRTFLEVKDSSKLVRKINGENHPENLYVYQLIAPFGTDYRIMQAKMQDDLNNYFTVKGRMEKRKLKCLVLTADDTALIKSKEGKEYLFIDDYKLVVNKVKVNKFLFYLNFSLTGYAISPYPIIDETKFDGEMGGIEIEGNITDHEFLNKALEKYKMHFRIEEREVDVLVIRDK